ncbi:MAG: TylF/MycF/NovP-related O-methyltransferase [Polaromonas sp.]|nr:TylF/MycF/NovP-related O-methyltransferase [Polaromonas sp.]MDP3751414.1 TylF/MycF/NovP-related O-methyltransferase [Polaromonas sp.]
MATKFGIISKLNFLQDFASWLIASINPAIVHNVEKYHCLKKVHYLSAIEGVEGDYLEFGVFTGSSFCHSIRCCRKLAYLNPQILQTRFFGFDSFAGFGDLAPEDEHPFYLDENFETSIHKVERRVGRVSNKDIEYQLIPGYFSDSLKAGVGQYKINKARIIFIDSDTYSSANEALEFCSPVVQEGTFIILDDFYSYKGSSEKGVARAFFEFLEKYKIHARQIFSYGMGGVVFVVSSKFK